jgi:hypothetical protein
VGDGLDGIVETAEIGLFFPTTRDGISVFVQTGYSMIERGNRSVRIKSWHGMLPGFSRSPFTGIHAAGSLNETRVAVNL